MNTLNRIKGTALSALFSIQMGTASAAMALPPVTFDLDTVGTQSANPYLVHSTMVDWTVATDPILDPVPPRNVYQSTGAQTNLKVVFKPVNLAAGESLRVKVDYRYLAPPSHPGIQPYNFLRFGAYNTHSTASFTDDQGYLADVSYWESATTSGSSSKDGDYSIRREDNVWDDFDMGPLLDNSTTPVHWTPPAIPETGDIRTLSQPDGSMATWPKASDEGTIDHAAVICITNHGDWVEICLYHGFPSVLVGRAIDTASSPIVSFDAVYLESPSDNAGFNIDNIGVQHLPVGMGCCGDCFEFEDLALGSTYVVGDTFTIQDSSGSNTLDVEAVPFAWSSGPVYTGGVAQVENGGNAGHGGNEFNLNNIGLRFSSATGSVPGFSFLFGEYGGNLNFSINGDFRNFANFQDINGALIGGAVVIVSGGNGNDQGQLMAFGTISEFSVGGQELYIDHLCPEIDQPDQPDDPDQPNGRLGVISGHKFIPDGLTPTGAPGWVIYLDQNRNGMLDATETSTVTDASGDYEFIGLAPDIYYVAEVMVPGWVQVVPGSPAYDYTVPLGVGDHVSEVNFMNIPEANEDCLEWYRANDPGALMASGTDSELKAMDFDYAISLMPGVHGLIDFEAFTVGDFTTKVLDANVTATLLNTGDPISINQPGISDQTTASSGLGYNTTVGGDKHLQVLPLNDGPDGGVELSFSRPATALGFYLMGLEDTKREVWAFIEFADGSNQAVQTDVGLNPGGGLQFFGFIAEECPITSFSLIELYDGEPHDRRDIFGVDDIRYVVVGGTGEEGIDLPEIDPNQFPVDFSDAGFSTGREADSDFNPRKPGQASPKQGRPNGPKVNPRKPAQDGQLGDRPNGRDTDPRQPENARQPRGDQNGPQAKPHKPGQAGHEHEGAKVDPRKQGEPGEQVIGFIVGPVNADGPKAGQAGQNNGRPNGPKVHPRKPGKADHENGRPKGPHFDPHKQADAWQGHGSPGHPDVVPVDHAHPLPPAPNGFPHPSGRIQESGDGYGNHHGPAEHWDALFGKFTWQSGMSR